MEFMEIVDKLADLSEKQTNELQKVFEGADDEMKMVLAKSYLGLFFDATCKLFGFDENTTWNELFETHHMVNEIEGDF